MRGQKCEGEKTKTHMYYIAVVQIGDRTIQRQLQGSRGRTQVFNSPCSILLTLTEQLAYVIRSRSRDRIFTAISNSIRFGSRSDSSSTSCEPHAIHLIRLFTSPFVPSRPQSRFTCFRSVPSKHSPSVFLVSLRACHPHFSSYPGDHMSAC